VSHTTHQTPEFAPAAPLNLTMDTKPPTTRPQTVDKLDDLDVFYLFFGLFRQLIWNTDPRMKQLIL
jgi:hypothetical protein